MRDLTKLENEKIVGAHIARASVAKAAELFGFSRDTN